MELVDEPHAHPDAQDGDLPASGGAVPERGTEPAVEQPADAPSADAGSAAAPDVPAADVMPAAAVPATGAGQPGAAAADEVDPLGRLCAVAEYSMLSKVEGSRSTPWVLDDDPDDDPDDVEDDEEQRPDSPHVCEKCGGGAPRWIGRCAHCKAWNTLKPGTAQPADPEATAAWRAARAQETAASVDATRGLRGGPPKGMGIE